MKRLILIALLIPIFCKAQSWKYSQASDEMTNKVIYIAQTDAVNKLDFKFPYEGGATATIAIRHKDQGNDIILRMDKGLFVEGGKIGTGVMVKFDDEKPKFYPFVYPGDGKNNEIFINRTASFISKMKKAKVMKIQAEFYQEGLNVMEFDVDGLEWKY